MWLQIILSFVFFYFREAKQELERATTELKELKRENKDLEQKLQWKVCIL